MSIVTRSGSQLAVPLHCLGARLRLAHYLEAGLPFRMSASIDRMNSASSQIRTVLAMSLAFRLRRRRL
jgi:hypothetical protein